MIAQPKYTSSRLYVFPVQGIGRTFIPASHEPRRVVGVRSYFRSELPRDPDNADVVIGRATNEEGAVFLNMVNAVSMAVYVRNLPLLPLSNSFIFQETKAVIAPGGAAFGTAPVVFPLDPNGLTDLGGCWVQNPFDPRVLALEFFFDDAWPR